MRSLYRHAVRMGRIETDPLAGVRAPRRPSRLPRVLSVDEAAALVTAPRRIESRDGDLARRDAAMLELLYATGMRISELAGLTLDRVDLDRRRLRVVGKGNKERQLLFGCPRRRRCARTWTPLARSWRAGARVGPRPSSSTRTAHELPPAARASSSADGSTLSARRLAQPRTPCATRSPRISLEGGADQGRAGAPRAREPPDAQVYTHLSDAASRTAYRDAHPRAGRSTGEPSSR